MDIPEDTKSWLLEAPEPCIRYRAQLLLTPENADPVLLDTGAFIQGHLKSLAGWRDEVLARHDKADLWIHRLAMLADLGVTRDTGGAALLVDDLMSNLRDDGSFPISIMIPKAFGGSGEANQDWIICDFPVILYALAKMTGCDTALNPAWEKLQALAGENYYPCCGSIPKFKGPGPRGGMCPYANLPAARALAANPALRDSAAAKTAAGAVLGHWNERKAKKYFLFGMGTDFRKLKFPMVWYNLLHVVSALRRIDGAAEDPRFKEMVSLLGDKLDADGRATAESIYMAYKHEEWSSKKAPSRLLTVLVYEALSVIISLP